MKVFIAIAVVLAVLALTQAQNDSNQPEVSEPEAPLSESEMAPSDSSIGEIPQRPEGSGRPLRPGRRPLGRRVPRPHLREDQPSANEDRESNLSQGRPPRRPVFFDINFDFGKQNKIGAHPETTTMTYYMT